MFLFWWIGFPSFINALSANKFKVINSNTIFIMSMVHVVLSSSVTAKPPEWYQVTSFWCFCYLKHGQPNIRHINIVLHRDLLLWTCSVYIKREFDTCCSVKLNDSMNSFSWLNKKRFFSCWHIRQNNGEFKLINNSQFAFFPIFFFSFQRNSVNYQFSCSNCY